MADIFDRKITLEEHECEIGCCPICNNDDLDYHSSSLEDGVAVYQWDCKKCGASGEEVSTLLFAGHDVFRDSIPPQVDALFSDGGLRLEKEREGVADIPNQERQVKLERGRYYIFQVIGDAEYDNIRHVSYEYYEKMGCECDIRDYELVGGGSLGSVREPGNYFGQITDIYSGNPPPDFRGSPLSSADIVVITPGDEAHAFFYEGAGFYEKIDYVIEQIGDSMRFPALDVANYSLETEDYRIRNRLLEDAPLCIKLSDYQFSAEG